MERRAYPGGVRRSRALIDCDGKKAMHDPGISTAAPRPLVRHPGFPGEGVEQITAAVAVDPSAAGLHLQYRILGDTARIRVPAHGDVLDPQRLWAHTCCELFVAPVTGDGYVITMDLRAAQRANPEIRLHYGIPGDRYLGPSGSSGRRTRVRR